MIRVGIFLIAVALIVGMVSYAARPIEIRDWYDLNAIRDNLGGSYLLINDLDSTTPGYTELASPAANGGRGWEPIGSVFILIHGHTTFQGTFDGKDTRYMTCLSTGLMRMVSGFSLLLVEEGTLKISA